MNKLTFVQMSGAPGSGKTTIATAVAPHLNAVILDHDMTKTALLESGISLQQSGIGSYAVIKALAKAFLQQNHSVTIDSPCFYDELLQFGIETAKQFGATYRYIECVTSDLKTLDERLKGRSTMRSQAQSITQPPIDVTQTQYDGEVQFERWIAEMKRPLNNILRLDTTQSIERCIKQAISFCLQEEH